MTKQLDDQNINRKHLVVLNMLSLSVFFILFYAVLTDKYLLKVDSWISTHIPALQTPFWTDIVIFITNINGVRGSLILSLFIIAFLVIKNYYHELLFYIVSYAGASVLFAVIKILVERTRPVLKIINEQGFSFPSGHSSMSMAIALACYFIFVNKVSSSLGRKLLLIFCIIWPILIAFTRVYLNVHWFSDTLAGFSLGIFWVTLILLFYPYGHIRVK
jgi:undecaprenyl-diphosphatase